jgi:hypothetical protein
MLCGTYVDVYVCVAESGKRNIGEGRGGETWLDGVRAISRTGN